MTHELREKPGHLIWRAYQLTWQLFSEESGALDITPVQEASLLVLAKRANIDQKTLAHLVALDRSTAGNVIGRLEERGLIARVPNHSDRRARLLSLTPRGEALSRKLRPIALRAAERLLAPLSPIERDEFMRLLRKVTGLADPLDMVAASPPTGRRLAGKRILFVGTQDDIGQQIAQRLAGEGAELAELAPPRPGADGKADAAFDERLAEVCRRLRGLDVLVNGGNITPAAAGGRSPDEIHAAIQQSAGARLTVVGRVLPQFLERGHGRIVNLALFPGTSLPPSLVTAVVAANASIAALTFQIAADYRRRGVVCNGVSPRLEPARVAEGGEAGPSHFAQAAPLDAALAVCFFASAEARAVTGSLLEIG